MVGGIEITAPISYPNLSYITLIQRRSKLSPSNQN
ncbi:hypothetical protein OIU79_015696 [Salix purpurea]|uniref:Uncharacterized protein n=1 Tax=Salix purpurea TaxID=77065 RepID=A0A9Q0SQL4_SALPP|nr:hypothetical protein OIU79_015696 [Salix purpurea]